MSTIYLDTHSDQMYANIRRGLCAWCGFESHSDGCFCRYCDSCSEYWKAKTRADYDDGRPRQEDCPDCVESEERGQDEALESRLTRERY
jgi:hypothetical protein